jgi:hypothetical protein
MFTTTTSSSPATFPKGPLKNNFHFGLRILGSSLNALHSQKLDISSDMPPLLFTQIAQI